MIQSIYKMGTVLLFVFLGICGLQAQFTSSGVVSDSSGDPLIGVSIVVKGTTVGTITDIDGSYSLNCPNDPSTLVFSYIGYQDVEKTVGSSDGKVMLTMADASTTLDEVVVTGLASTVKRSNLANSVASISSKELTGVTTQSTMDGALYGKFKGADIRANSGAPGGGFSIRLRGVTSVNLNQQPVYIVDGIFVDNSTFSLNTNQVSAAAGGGNTSSNQDDASNRIADLIPEDIESIEILKGASAAAIYGVGGAGGVVVINTKKGGYNQANSVNFSQTIGVASPIRLLGDRGWDAAKVESVFGPDEAAKFNANGNSPLEEIIYNDDAAIQSTSALSFMGGSAKTKYFVSGTWRDQDGLVENTGYKKGSVRLNLSQKISERIEVNLSSTYINADADRGFFNNSNANTTVGYALAFTKPWENLAADANGNFPANNAVGSNVLETIDKITNEEKINRFMGSVSGTYSILQTGNQSLKLGGVLGLDQFTIRNNGLFPQELSYYRDPSSDRGVIVGGFGNSNRNNATGYLVHTLNTSSNLMFRTQVGAQQLNQNSNALSAVAIGINGSQTNVDQSENQTVTQEKRESQIKGAFLQEEINWDDKIMVTLGIRGDKSSNNGDPNEIFWNPKANLAINLHNLMDIGGNTISQIKPRIAFGQSARFAGFSDRFNELDPTSISGTAGLQTSDGRGNPNVLPETQKELEFGIDLGFLDNRILFDATYYIKTIEDLLLRQNVPPSSGFTRKVVNAGELENVGIELELKAGVVRTDDFSWDTGIGWWKNNSEITRLDIPQFTIGGFAASLGQGLIQEGFSPSQLIGTIDMSQCNGDDCSNVDPDGDGFMVYGNMEADFNLSWNNSISFKGLELNWLLHWKQGGENINLSTLLYDLGGLTWDFDETGLDPNGDLSNGDYRLSTAFAHPGAFIEDASYVRLREIGLYYNLGDMVNGINDLRIGVSGRNLLNSFEYNSYDPEVSNFGNNVLINAVEVTPYPSSKTFNFHLSLTL